MTETADGITPKETNDYAPLDAHSAWIIKAQEKVAIVASFGASAGMATVAAVKKISVINIRAQIDALQEIAHQYGNIITPESLQELGNYANLNEKTAIAAVVASAAFFGVGALKVLASDRK